MIKENLNIKFTAGETSSEYEGQIIVPSQVMTSTSQNEDVNLEKSPNVTIKLKGEAARGVKNLLSQYKKIKAEFELVNKTYAMNVSIIESTNDYVVLQYCDGLTAAEVSHTFECVNSSIETSNDKSSGSDVVKDASTQFLYDGTPVKASEISFEQMKYHTITVGSPTENDITLTPKSSFPGMSTSDAEYEDTLTATYKGITINVPVKLTITIENLHVLTMKWGNAGVGPAQLVYIYDYKNDDPFESYCGISLRFFDEKNNDVTEYIVNNNTINVSFEGYEGSIFNGTTTWVDQRQDCIESGSDGVDYFLSIEFADINEFIRYKDAYNNENGNSGNYDGLITKCNVSVEGYDISPSSFSISGANF